MRRFHLFEVADQAWCPRSIRDAVTDYLHWTYRVNNPFLPIVPRLRRALEASNAHEVVDLCSGAGGPWLQLANTLGYAEQYPVQVCLTDRYPNLPALDRVRRASRGMISYQPRPVDATRVPDDLAGFRTLFASFHHFRPGDTRRIVEDATTRDQGIGVFEATHRSPRALALMFAVPIMVLLGTPFIRPFRLDRLFWTYLVPIVPLLALFDGIVSCLRTYTPAELQAMVAGLGDESYTWEVGEEHGPRMPIPITYLIGYPRTQ